MLNSKIEKEDMKRLTHLKNLLKGVYIGIINEDNKEEVVRIDFKQDRLKQGSNIKALYTINVYNFSDDDSFDMVLSIKDDLHTCTVKVPRHLIHFITKETKLSDLTFSPYYYSTTIGFKTEGEKTLEAI